MVDTDHGRLDDSGNLFIVGSIANIIVVDAARKHGIVIDWRRHARTDLPVAQG